MMRTHLHQGVGERFVRLTRCLSVVYMISYEKVNKMTTSYFQESDQRGVFCKHTLEYLRKPRPSSTSVR
jgi:hypothetical protein